MFAICNIDILKTNMLAVLSIFMTTTPSAWMYKKKWFASNDEYKVLDEVLQRMNGPNSRFLCA